MMPNLKKQKILCVDDDVDFLSYIVELVSSWDYEVIPANSVEEAKGKIDLGAKDFLCVISDYRMQDGDGFDVRRHMIAEYKDVPFFILSAFVDKEIALKGLDLTISSFVAKPFKDDELKLAIIEKTKDRALYFEEFYELRKLFLEETNEILEELEPLLLKLEESASESEVFDQIFRLVHTVKGASGVLDCPPVTKFFHSYEDMINLIRLSTNGIPPVAIDLLLKAFDQMGQTVKAFERSEEDNLDLSIITSALSNFKLDSTSQKSPGKKDLSEDKTISDSKTDEKKDAILVSTEMLDEFLANSGEITVIRNTLKKLVAVIQKKLPSDEDVTVLSGLLEEMNKINSTMQHQLTEQRKISLSATLKRIPRMVRDLSRQLDKKATIEMNGQNLRVDPKISQILSMSMTHLIRNSMDHGFESPEERLSSGKNESGLIDINFSQDHENIYVKISDDGRGIDPEIIKAKAIEKGMYTKDEIENFSKKKILSQIFEPGFSTAQELTDVSGRGVGMDMVRTSIEDFGGKIDLDSTVGEGSIIDITFPIPKSVTIISALLVGVNGDSYSIPQEVIHRLISFDKTLENSQIEEFEGACVINIDGNLVPIIKIKEILYPNQKDEKNDKIENLVIISIENNFFALKVDEIFDVEELVVKPLINDIMKIGKFKGATFLGDSTIGLILDCKAIIEGAIGIGITYQEEKVEEVNDTARGILDELMIVRIKGNTDKVAIHLNDVFRLERIDINLLGRSGKQDVIPYRNKISPIIDLNKLLNESFSTPLEEQFICVVFERQNKHYFVIVDEVEDVRMADDEEISCFGSGDYLEGTIRVDGKVLRVIDVEAILKSSPSYLRQLEHIEMEEEDKVVPIVKKIEEIKEEPIEEVVGWGLF